MVSMMNDLKAKYKSLQSLHMKGQANLSGGAVAIVTLILVLAIGAIIITGFQGDLTADSYADNITDDGLAALDSMSGLVGPLALVLIAAVIIAVVAGGLGRAAR